MLLVDFAIGGGYGRYKSIDIGHDVSPSVWMEASSSRAMSILVHRPPAPLRLTTWPSRQRQAGLLFPVRCRRQNCGHNVRRAVTNVTEFSPSEIVTQHAQLRNAMMRGKTAEDWFDRLQWLYGGAGLSRTTPSRSGYLRSASSARSLATSAA
jgi:hypothetical protein